MTVLYETARCLVRQFTPEDLDDFASLCADPLVLRYVGDGTTLTRSEVADWIEICKRKYRDRGYGTSAVYLKADNRFLGYCGVVRAPENAFDELVYVFHQFGWGQGFATEVAAPMLDYVFSRSALTRIYATIDPANLASVHVAEKLGFHYEKTEPDELGPVAYYVIHRKDLRP
ncbi:MAG: GNAT family N-acetyltransferase [Pseudomonadales bacterium]|nr:GNAT family N-acetyltransferase [Pseudomonadales bacterium]